jgi:hypothetical protein
MYNIAACASGGNEDHMAGYFPLVMGKVPLLWLHIERFEKIHEADAHTIADLMAYIDKLVDTQDAVMHDFNGEHGDGGNRSRKRSGEAYMVDPPRPSTFLEGDFNMVMDDQCKSHCDAKHTMSECDQLKHALGVPSDSKKTKSSNNDD